MLAAIKSTTPNCHLVVVGTVGALEVSDICKNCAFKKLHCITPFSPGFRTARDASSVDAICSSAYYRSKRLMSAELKPPVLDSLDRPLKSLRLSVTDRCNLRCLYCMPEEEYVWLPREELLTFEELN